MLEGVAVRVNVGVAERVKVAVGGTPVKVRVTVLEAVGVHVFVDVADGVHVWVTVGVKVRV